MNGIFSKVDYVLKYHVLHGYRRGSCNVQVCEGGGVVIGDAASVIFRNSINASFATGGAPAVSTELHIVSFATTAVLLAYCRGLNLCQKALAGTMFPSFSLIHNRRFHLLSRFFGEALPSVLVDLKQVAGGAGE